MPPSPEPQGCLGAGATVAAPVVLRDYQQQLLADLRVALRSHRRVCAVMPTGAGKGQTIGAIVRGAAGRGHRVLVLAHRAELIEQLTGTVRAWGLEPAVIAPGNPGNGHPRCSRQSGVGLIAVGSVQTVVRRLDRLAPPDLIIQDEAHHLVAGNVWGRIINAWPDAYLIGKTATPERLDGKGLGVEAGGYFEALPMPRLRRRGQLLPLRPHRPGAASISLGSHRHPPGGTCAPEPLGDPLSQPHRGELGRSRQRPLRALDHRRPVQPRAHPRAGRLVGQRPAAAAPR